MKRFADRKPSGRPFRGFVAECSACGLMVVHAESTSEPMHMHARSRLCRELAAKRQRAAVAPSKGTGP